MIRPKCIFFFNESPVKYQLRYKTKIRQWIHQVAQQEQHQIIQVSYIFCTDAYLLPLNQQYLNHPTYTDILTFDYSDKKEFIESDIFISIDRVKENALEFKVSVAHELYRVMIHGILHLCGYADKSKAQQKQMRAKEDFYVEQLLEKLIINN